MLTVYYIMFPMLSNILNFIVHCAAKYYKALSLLIIIIYFIFIDINHIVIRLHLFEFIIV